MSSDLILYPRRVHIAGLSSFYTGGGDMENFQISAKKVISSVQALYLICTSFFTFAFSVTDASTEHSTDEFFVCIGHCCLLLTYCTSFLSSTFPLGYDFQNSSRSWCDKFILPSTCCVRLLY